MSKPPLSHYSPVFANKRWADQAGYISYYRDKHRNKIAKAPQALRQWGRRRGLYSWDVETALSAKIETDAAKVYESLCQFEELDLDSRIIWAQFLLSQVVRTPTFIRYEKGIQKLTGISNESAHYLVGCRECGDLACITSRQWCFLIAHEDDFFIRSDNPVFLSGFIERRETCLFYPLSPEVCFVACSMPEGWQPEQPLPYQIPESCGYLLEKGSAWFLNFQFARSASESLILCPTKDGILSDAMFYDVLGHYSQPPFPLHTTLLNNVDDAFESIRVVMGIVDNVNYPKWCSELEPFFAMPQEVKIPTPS